MFNIETILGISKQSLKRKIHVWFDSEDATKAEALLARRGKLYSLEDLKFLHGFMLSGHDACVLDNSDDYSVLELHTARANEERHEAARLKLEAAETRGIIESFVRECWKNRPPTKRELRGRTLEEELALSVQEITANTADVRAICIIMNNEDTAELPGKVMAWRKVLSGSD